MGEVDAATVLGLFIVAGSALIMAGCAMVAAAIKERRAPAEESR